MRSNIKWLVGLCMMGTIAWSDPMSPPDVLRVGHEDYPSPDLRRIQMVSSLAVSPGGRMWVTWYAGPTPREDDNNYVVLATSGDDGVTWEDVLILDPDGPGPVRAFDPEIWLDPLGRVWLFWAQAVRHGHEAHTWAMITDNPDDAGAVWGDPFHVAPGVMMCKPIVLSNGEWLFPISDWSVRYTKDPDAASAAVWISPDKGKTFALRGAALVPVDQRNFDEHMVVERKDGSLWMLVRTRYGIGSSISADRGKTWTALIPSNIPHPSARFFIRRLQSGNLLLVKHGDMEHSAGRSHLTAFVSKDDGATWEGGLLLDERGGLSYPDGQQVADGTIYITYDYMRRRERAILMAAFTEEDVLAGKSVSDAVRLRVAVSDLGRILEDPTAPYDPANFELDDNQNGVPLERAPLAILEPTGDDEVDTLDVGALIWIDRGFVFSVIPDGLRGKRFIRTNVAGTQARVTRDGYVYIMLRRGSASARRVQEAGFVKTDMHEFIPFALGGRFRDMYGTSVYQKFVREGETVHTDLWGTFVFAAE
jgi:hypothetical protein